MRRFLVLLVLVFALAACGNQAVDEESQQTDPLVNENGHEEQTDALYETIALDEIEAYVEDGYIIADVREEEEYDAGHIPGAQLAPLSDLENGEFGPLDEDESYIIICRSGNRSMIASEILTNAGFDLVNVSEGMASWQGEIEGDMTD